MQNKCRVTIINTDKHRHTRVNGDLHKSHHVAKAKGMESRVLDSLVQFCQNMVQSIGVSTTANNELQTYMKRTPQSPLTHS